MSVPTRDIVRPSPMAKTDRVPRHVYALSLALAIVSASTAALTFFVPEILEGPPVSNGNARGTALVMLTLAVPVLLLSMRSERRGSWRAPYFWLGSVFYLGYNAFLLLFLTPFNSLFLLYVANQSLALFALFALVISRHHLPPSPTRDLPVRGLSIFIWSIVSLNILAWLQTIIPATFSANPGAFLNGLDVATNAVFVEDLTVWLPVMAMAAWWMWKHRPLGILLTGSWLAYGILEGIGVATDQWFGHQADPMSPHASEGVIVLMLGLAAVNLVGLYFYIRGPKRPAGAQVGASREQVIPGEAGR